MNHMYKKIIFLAGAFLLSGSLRAAASWKTFTPLTNPEHIKLLARSLNSNLTLYQLLNMSNQQALDAHKDLQKLDRQAKREALRELIKQALTVYSAQNYPEQVEDITMIHNYLNNEKSRISTDNYHLERRLNEFIKENPLQMMPVTQPGFNTPRPEGTPKNQPKKSLQEQELEQKLQQEFKELNRRIHIQFAERIPNNFENLGLEEKIKLLRSCLSEDMKTQLDSRISHTYKIQLMQKLSAHMRDKHIHVQNNPIGKKLYDFFDSLCQDLEHAV
jgi:hypothetical protein